MAIAIAATESGSAAFLNNAAPTTMKTASGGAGKGVVVKKLLIANVTGTDRTVNVYKVPSGGSISGTDYLIVDTYTVAAHATTDVRKCAGMHLENGDSIRAMASAASALRFDLSTLDES
jgi:hypothetical protein